MAEYKKCTACNGEGKIIVKAYAGNGSHYEKCYACGGSGDQRDCYAKPNESSEPPLRTG